MALWNPFNLFKKKETKSAVEPATHDESTDQDDAASGPLGTENSATQEAVPRVVKTETVTIPEAPLTDLPPAVAVKSDAPETKPSPDTKASPQDVSRPEVSSAPSEVEAVAKATQTPEPIEGNDSQAADWVATEIVEVPTPEIDQAPAGKDVEAAVVEVNRERLVPFDEQVAPAKPIDLYEKISKKPTVEKAKKVVEPESSGGLTGWFRSAISKTARVLNTDIRDLVGRDGRLVDDDFLKELFTHLVKTDMGVAPASEIRDAIAKKYRARKVHLAQLITEAKTTISEIMKQDEVRLQLADVGTTVIMVVGVNGSGKTTSIAKLARMFRQDGKSVVLGAGDTFRAAAVEQLRQWAGRIGADIVTGEDQSDPASVAYKAAQFAKENQIDICIVDTAGRLQTQSHLMQELSKIRRVLDKVIPGSPHETLLVLDSTAGQNAISQARGFSEAAGCSGIVLAKLDGTAKGGVAIPIRKEFDLPVKFIGFGETADAIAPFDVARYVDALFNFDEK